MKSPQPDLASHPSPDRARTGLAALLYGLVAAPVAWGVGELVNAGLAQEACFPGTEPLAAPAFTNLHSLHVVVLVISLAVSASAAIIALGAWRATWSEQPGDPHALLSIGEGRSRFMALAGLLTSAGFFVGTLFSVPAVLLVPSC
jgi:hypothetical protein